MLLICPLADAWGVVAGIAANALAQRSERAVAFTRKLPPAILLAHGNTAATAAPAPSGRPSREAPKKKEETRDSSGWLDEIQSEGYRNLSVDQLIALKIHGVDGEYIRNIRAAGLQPTADQLVAFRIHGVTAEFIAELKQIGFEDLEPDQLVALRIHDADPAWIREIESLGYSDLSAEKIVELRIHGVTPEFILEARNHGLDELSLDQLIQLKIHGILNAR
jgi:hypothetical protein